MDQFLGWLTNPLVLLLAGAAVKYVPGIRQKLANDVIPLLTAVLAFLGGTIAPEVAATAAGPLSFYNLVGYATGTEAVMVANKTAAFGLFGIGGTIAAALVQSAQTWFLHKVVGRPFFPPRPEDSLRKLRK